MIAELLDDRGNRARIAALMAGTDLQYDMGRHPLAGRWLPDLQMHLTDGLTQIVERLQAVRPVLVDLTGDATTLADAVDGWTDRLDILTARSADRRLGASAILVRPDGYLAWATDATPDRSARRDLHEALTTWFGSAH